MVANIWIPASVIPLYTNRLKLASLYNGASHHSSCTPRIPLPTHSVSSTFGCPFADTAQGLATMTNWGFPPQSIPLSSSYMWHVSLSDNKLQQRWIRSVTIKNIRQQWWPLRQLHNSDIDCLSNVSINYYCWQYYLDFDGDVLLLLLVRLLYSVDILWHQRAR